MALMNTSLAQAPATPLQAAVNAVDNNIEVLKSRVQDLRSRLGPVLDRSMGEDSAKCEVKDNSGTPMLADLERHCDRLRSITDDVNDILSRLCM